MQFRLNSDKRGYVMKLSGNETYNWANRPNCSWPCSTLSGYRIVVVVDSNGLCDLTIDGESRENMDIDGNELSAIVADHLPQEARHLWPVWEK